MTRILSYRQRRQRLYLLRRLMQKGMGFSIQLEGEKVRCEAVNSLIEFQFLTPRVALFVTDSDKFCIAGILQVGVWGEQSAHCRKVGKGV